VTGLIVRRTKRLRRPLVLGFLAAAALAAGLLAWRQYPRQFLRRGESALAARDYDQAHEQLARYLSHRPNDPHARLLAARAARNRREYYEAYEHLRRCRESGGDGEAVEAEKSLIAVQRGEDPPADLRRRAEQDDELALVILEVLIQYDIDAYLLHQALHGLTRYLVARPDDLHALMARGYVWERFLYFSDALEDYKRAVAAHPDSERARLKLGETLLIVATPAEALVQYEWLADRRPQQREVRLGLARCRRRLGQPEQARPLLAALLAAAPEDGEVLWERGQLELDEGRPAEAEAWLRKAARASPRDRRVAYSLSRCLLALGRRDEAEEVNARVADIDADLRRLGRVRQAVMQRPNDATLRCEGGLLFLKNGERQEGLKWLRLALRLDPSHQAARDALAKEEGRPTGRR
jgi:tetratricopeptide (TPR) repeat protein